MTSGPTRPAITSPTTSTVERYIQSCVEGPSAAGPAARGTTHLQQQQRQHRHLRAQQSCYALLQ
jgi:hypothetical protein